MYPEADSASSYTPVAHSAIYPIHDAELEQAGPDSLGTGPSGARSRVRFSTHAFPQAEQVGMWRELISTALVPVDSVRREGQPFEAEAVIGSAERLTGALVRATPHRLQLGGAGDRLLLAMAHTGSSVQFCGEGETLQVGPGDVLVLGGGCGGELALLGPGRCEATLWALSREFLDPSLREQPGVVRSLRGGEGAGLMVATYLRNFTERLGALDIPASQLLVRHFAQVLALAVGTLPDAIRLAGETVSEAHLQRIMAYASRRLFDHELSPRAAAAAAGVSVRYLHVLFERTGTSFSRWVSLRRLEEARRLLTSPDAAGQSVVAVAYASGFSSVSGFYRAFRARFGQTPRAVQLGAVCCAVGPERTPWGAVTPGEKPGDPLAHGRRLRARD